MKTIPETFKKYSYDFKLLKRTGDVAMYEQSKIVSPELTVSQYEVHIVQISKECVFKKQYYPERERLATAGEFGYFGWSYQKYENAIKKFNELVEVQNGKLS